jgi:hypothetical protein
MTNPPRPISRLTLLGDLDEFTENQRAAREAYIEHFPHPPSEWLYEADPLNRIATGIYNTVVESGTADPRFRNDESWQMADGFAYVLKTGGDALLWTLIRIGLDESTDDDVVALCERRGFGVYRTSLVDPDPFAPTPMQ